MIQTIPLKDRILDFYYNPSNYSVFKHIGNMNKTPNNRIEDAIQESALSAIKRLDTYDTTLSLDNWLYRIFKNKCIDMNRKERCRRCNSETDMMLFLDLPSNIHLLDSNPGKEPSPEQPLLEEDRKRVLMEAIHSLPLEHQQVISEHYFNGQLKYHEIAEKLNIPIGTVKSRMHLATKKLKARLSSYKDELMFVR